MIAIRKDFPKPASRFVLALLIRFAVALFILSLSAPAQAQQITLKFSHFVPSSHGMQTDFIEPWSKALSEKTGGKVKVDIHAVNSAFGNAARQADQIKAGVTDIALGLRGIP